MDTEIVDYHGQKYSLQTFCHAPNSVLFSMHGNSSSSEHLQEMGVTNTSESVPVSDVGPTSKENINLQQRSHFPGQPYHQNVSQPLTSWSGSIVRSDYFRKFIALNTKRYNIYSLIPR
jgi:hypothetical protein